MRCLRLRALQNEVSGGGAFFTGAGLLSWLEREAAFFVPVSKSDTPFPIPVDATEMFSFSLA